MRIALLRSSGIHQQGVNVDIAVHSFPIRGGPLVEQLGRLLCWSGALWLLGPAAQHQQHRPPDMLKLTEIRNALQAPLPAKGYRPDAV